MNIIEKNLFENRLNMRLLNIIIKIFEYRLINKLIIVFIKKKLNENRLFINLINIIIENKFFN